MVPKKKGGGWVVFVEEFKDYRPISMVGSLYKLIAKVLAIRLKRVMHCLINEAQNTFVEGRQIMDASLLVNEVIDTMLKRKEREILCAEQKKKRKERSCVSWI